MRLNKILPSVFLSVATTTGIWGQVNDPYFSKAQQYARDVYEDAPQYTTGDYIKTYAEILKRVEVVKYSADRDGKKLPLLSGVDMILKYNPTLKNDFQGKVNPETFNPLKYFLPFYPKSDVKYRIDNSPYILIIHPQQH